MDYLDKQIRVAGWGKKGFWKIKKLLKYVWKIDIDKGCLVKRLRKYGRL